MKDPTGTTLSPEEQVAFKRMKEVVIAKEITLEDVIKHCYDCQQCDRAHNNRYHMCPTHDLMRSAAIAAENARLGKPDPKIESPSSLYNRSF